MNGTRTGNAAIINKYLFDVKVTVNIQRAIQREVVFNPNHCASRNNYCICSRAFEIFKTGSASSTKLVNNTVCIFGNYQTEGVGAGKNCAFAVVVKAATDGKRAVQEHFAIGGVDSLVGEIAVIA